jgi:hypothetical protein
MKTIDLKNHLIHKIAEINDESFLKALKTIIDSKTDSTVYTLTAEQRVKIQEGKSQIEQGNYYTNQQVETEINKWLDEK